MISMLLLAALAAAVPAPASTPAITFTDVTTAAGVAFRHVHGGSGEKYYIETMGSGACWFDYDGDGDVDLYAVNSGPLPGWKSDGGPAPTNHLFRNEGKGRFADVTAAAGVEGRGYGMGCTAGDIDNDGDIDLYVTAFGPNLLYRNEGNGRFSDVTAAAGVGEPRWSASAAFADYDRDGDLDLYVTNYLDFTLENNKWCGQRKPGYRTYCHPDEYNGVPDTLYRNRGDGRFDDVSVAAGVADPIGKGLGVVWTDVNDDGWPDIYVANDKTINFLYLNRRDGTFEDASVTSGAGLAERGVPQAGMGIDTGDIDGDGRFDLIVTNLDFETNTLFANASGAAGAAFNDATYASGLGEPNFLNVGFGVDFLDFDNDGDTDILIANGHIIDNIALYRDQVTWEQSRSMLANDGKGRFKEVGPSLGRNFTAPNVGRGLAVADYDDDGDLDFYVVNNDRGAQLLRSDGVAGHWLRLSLKGTRSNRDALGARVRLATKRPDGSLGWQVDEVRSASSYCSQNDRRLHFGLGAATQAERIEIRWPSGATQTLEAVKADQTLEVIEPAEPGRPATSP